MGMYDEITFTCPGCGKSITEQSKAGECNLNTFTSDAVPVEIAADIGGNMVRCGDCGKTWKIFQPDPVVLAVPMSLRSLLSVE